MLKKVYNRYIKLKQEAIEKRALKHFDGRMVLMFHEVSDKKEEWYDARYSISAVGFRKLLDEIQSLGYDIVSPYEVLVDDGQKKICLTFDDVFAGVYENAFPIMQEKKVPFIIFPALLLLGKPGYINDKILLEFQNYERAYIGAHSKTHCVLKKEKTERCLEEIEESKEILEKKINRRVELFAYPYGSLSEVGKKDIKIAKKCYKYAFSTLQSCIDEKVDPYFIPRMNINESNYNNVLECLRGLI